MTRKELAQKAFEECCDPRNIIHRGTGGAGTYWNCNSKQFMYVPAFWFTGIASCSKYRYDAKDESGRVHSFLADSAQADLSPIWAELPEGVIRLTVTALELDGSDYAPVGARTFFKLASFPEKTPEAKCSYRECANRAYKYAMSHPFVRHWLTDGTPDPHYDLNIYPSKFISSLANTMIQFSRLYPEIRDEAMEVAVRSADWMMSITPRGDHPLANLPPTYYFDFCPDPEEYGIITANYHAAKRHCGTVMMIYPASAGLMYMHLSEATGDRKYFEEALKIGKYYLDTVEENGSWFSVRSEETGLPTVKNYVAPAENVLPFLSELYERTGDPVWKRLCDGAVGYIEREQLAEYNWEGQFEDIGADTEKYFDMSQYGPVGLARYYLKYRKDEPEYVERARELMRFAEDQFVVWNRTSPWYRPSEHSVEAGKDVLKLHTPAALEQYYCYWPIDASAAHTIRGFLDCYRAGLGDLYLAKARVLADQMTVVQEESGRIPTFWIDNPEDLSNFWFNCMFSACLVLMEISEFDNIRFE